MAMEKTFDAAEAEPRLYAEWESTGCFEAGANARPGAEAFSIVIPPPNVTGSLHMGHALNNTLQDVLIRWKRMQGYDVLWQPGTDHAGIATQMVVERRLAEEGGPDRRTLGRETFVAKVWEWKEQSGGTILTQLKRLGASCDWSRERFTMDEGLSRAVSRVFVELYNKGLIYKDKRLVNWDPVFETAISDMEVEQIEVQGKLWRFRYPLDTDENGEKMVYQHPVTTLEDGTVRDWRPEDGPPEEFVERDYLVVATTRPETMLGDSGVAVHPEDARYEALVGHRVILPLVGRSIPIVADEYADPTTGTGAVKMTPAHDFNDFQVGKRRLLRNINVMTPKAAMFLKDNADFVEDCDVPEETLALDGLDRFEARKRVVAMMEAAGLLDGIDEHPHMVPHGDRSKAPIEPYLTDQWFVDAHTLAKEGIAAVKDGRVTFHPKNWEKTYFHWMENIEPWCVSRQLWWGHQIPVWYGPDGTAFCEETEEAAHAAAHQHYDKGVILTQDPDVLDTWFSSALWPFSTMGWPEHTPELKRYYPTSVLVTGFDIIPFWVARMMKMAFPFMGEKPFTDVYIHALVRDAQGRKMSKSIGNVIDPLDVIEEYGADALRFTLTSMAAMGRDIKLSLERVAGYRNFGTKLWNAARFCEMNGCARVPGFDPKSCEQTVNRWIVGETARLREAVDEALAAYRFNDAASALYAHIWGVFCDWYVEMAKPMLQGPDGPAKEETRAVAAWALDQCCALLHPIMPFVTEEIWRVTGGEGALMHADWPRYTADELVDAGAEAEIRWTIALIEAIRSVRAEMNVPPSAQIPLVLTDFSMEAAQRLLRNGPVIRRLARLSEAAVAEQAPEGAIVTAIEEATVNLPLADVIDAGAERARLEKALAKLEKELKGLDSKLANEAFLAKAPEHVVEEQRERLGVAREEAEKLRGALSRLAAMG